MKDIELARKRGWIREDVYNQVKVNIESRKKQKKSEGIDESKIQDYLFSQIKNFVEANKIRLFDMGKIEYILSV